MITTNNHTPAFKAYIETPKNTARIARDVLRWKKGLIKGPIQLYGQEDIRYFKVDDQKAGEITKSLSKAGIVNKLLKNEDFSRIKSAAKRAIEDLSNIVTRKSDAKAAKKFFEENHYSAKGPYPLGRKTGYVVFKTPSVFDHIHHAGLNGRGIPNVAWSGEKFKKVCSGINEGRHSADDYFFNTIRWYAKIAALRHCEP